MQSDTPSPAAEGRGGKLVLHRRDVMATEYGEVSFAFPQVLTIEDHDDVMAWLAIVQRKLARFVVEPAGREALSREKAE